MSDLGTPGGMGSLAYGVNGVGQVVGTASISTASADQHAVLFDQVSIVDLGTQGGGSYGYATNNATQIVGLAFIAGNSALHPFLYSNGVMFDLNTLVDPASGWTLTDARDINGSGQISGVRSFRRATARGAAQARARAADGGPGQRRLGVLRAARRLRRCVGTVATQGGHGRLGRPPCRQRACLIGSRWSPEVVSPHGLKPRPAPIAKRAAYWCVPSAAGSPSGTLARIRPAASRRRVQGDGCRPEFIAAERPSIHSKSHSMGALRRSRLCQRRSVMSQETSRQERSTTPGGLLPSLFALEYGVIWHAAVRPSHPPAN
jgi:probable HAF family extracellular repeat protein